MTVTALIVAAGKGERLGGGVPKQYRMLGGKPVLRWAVETPARYIAMIGSKRKVIGVVKELEKEGIPRHLFERVFALREGSARLPGEREADELFASYMAQIERVIEAVDRLDTSNGR